MNVQDQLTLVTDILKNQQAQRYGTEDEYEQLHRLAEKLKADGQLNDQVQQTLMDISEYCSTRNCAEKSTPIDSWISAIDEFTLPYPHE